MYVVSALSSPSPVHPNPTIPPPMPPSTRLTSPAEPKNLILSSPTRVLDQTSHSSRRATSIHIPITCAVVQVRVPQASRSFTAVSGPSTATWLARLGRSCKHWPEEERYWLDVAARVPNVDGRDELADDILRAYACACAVCCYLPLWGQGVCNSKHMEYS